MCACVLCDMDPRPASSGLPRRCARRGFSSLHPTYYTNCIRLLGMHVTVHGGLFTSPPINGRRIYAYTADSAAYTWYSDGEADREGIHGSGSSRRPDQTLSLPPASLSTPPAALAPQMLPRPRPEGITTGRPGRHATKTEGGVRSEALRLDLHGARGAAAGAPRPLCCRWLLVLPRQDAGALGAAAGDRRGSRIGVMVYYIILYYIILYYIELYINMRARASPVPGA
jgi:hypothetical protein